MHEADIDLEIAERIKDNPIIQRRLNATAQPKQSLYRQSVERVQQIVEESKNAENIHRLNVVLEIGWDIESHFVGCGGIYSSPERTFEERQNEANKPSYFKLKAMMETAKTTLERTESALQIMAGLFTEEQKAQMERDGSVQVGFESPRGFRGERINWQKWDNMEKEHKDKTEIAQVRRDFYKAVVEMYQQKLKERINPKAVKEIIKEAQELRSEHKRLSQKVQKIIDMPSVPPKDAAIFMDKKERMRLIESQLDTLEERFEWHETPPDLTFPKLDDDLMSGKLQHQYYNFSLFNQKIKEIERIYCESKAREEASKKA